MTGVDGREWFTSGEWVGASADDEAEPITRARSEVQAAEIVRDHNSLVAALRDAQAENRRLTAKAAELEADVEHWRRVAARHEADHALAHEALRDAQAEVERLRTIGALHAKLTDEMRTELVEARAALARVERLCDEYRANCDPTSMQARVAELFRAAVQGDANPEATHER